MGEYGCFTSGDIKRERERESGWKWMWRDTCRRGFAWGGRERKKKCFLGLLLRNKRAGPRENIGGNSGCPTMDQKGPSKKKNESPRAQTTKPTVCKLNTSPKHDTHREKEHRGRKGDPDQPPVQAPGGGTKSKAPGLIYRSQMETNLRSSRYVYQRTQSKRGGIQNRKYTLVDRLVFGCVCEIWRN